MKKYLGTPVITLFALFPLVLWYKYASFENMQAASLSVGQALGLVGSVLFSINFILSGRFKLLEPYFSGLNQIYIVHHKIGAYAFILLLYHPVAISISYLPLSVIAAAKILLTGPSNLPVFLGLAALIIMIVALIITFFIKLPYQIWKLTHKFLGLSLFLASLHVLLIPSTVSINVGLRLYILGFAVLGLLAFTYRVLFRKYLVKKYTYKVYSAGLVNRDVTEVNLVPVGKPMTYLPGQFIFINFASLGITTEIHPFSLTSSPDTNYISLAIKSSGDYTETVKLLKKESVAQIEGPFGYFTYSRYENLRQIWIAGGIGIAPFLSMARSLKTDSDYKIDLYYQVGVPEEAVYLTELKNISNKVPNLVVTPHYSKTQERLSADIIAQNSPDFLTADIFLCGPPPMMASLRSQFKKLGVKNSHIHSEEFALE